MKKSIYSSQQRKLISWLKKAREDQGLSMRELAAKLKCSHSLVGKVEQGERRLDIIEYVAYCQSLKIDPLEGLKLITK